MSGTHGTFREEYMPAKTGKQRRFMGPDYARAKAGKKTKTGMTKKQLREYAKS